jgi:hypothetical protein
LKKKWLKASVFSVVIKVKFIKRIFCVINVFKLVRMNFWTQLKVINLLQGRVQVVGEEIKKYWKCWKCVKNVSIISKNKFKNIRVRRNSLMEVLIKNYQINAQNAKNKSETFKLAKIVYNNNFTSVIAKTVTSQQK